MEGRIFRVVAVMSLLLHIVKGDVCEHSWNLYENTCFKFFDETIVQAETEEHCSSRGARPLTVLTPNLVAFLVQHMGDNGNMSYWCNAESGEINPSLLTSTSTPSPHHMITSTPSPHHMITSTPSRRHMITSPKSTAPSCSYLQDKAIYKGDCDAPRGFICEKDSIVPPVTCPQGTDKVGTNCFWTTSHVLNKTKATETCIQQGGRLANLETRRKRAYAIATVALKKKNLWVDATIHERKIKWKNGDILDLTKEKPFVRIKNEGGDCVFLGVSDDSESGTSWIFGACNKTAYGLCEKEGALTTTTELTTTSTAATTPAPTCPGVTTNDREKDGICYWETTYETPRFDWDNARKFCQVYGGDLASYKDAREEVLGLGQAKGHEGGLWMGLRREPNSNVFRWSDGSDLTYTNWAPGQPKFKGNYKLCVAHTGKNSTWEVIYCGVNRWFVCKIPKATIPSSPVRPTAAPDITCTRYKSNPLITWKYHQGYCYAAYWYRIFTWHTARSFCQDNDAYLASLHSFDEINFLLTLTSAARNSLFLGLRAKGLHSSYRWDDGTPLDFVNWDEDDLYDDSSNTDTCVSFVPSSGSWKKSHCNQLGYAICKARNGTDDTFTTPVPTSSLLGYCPDGWYTFGNKCYRLFGIKEKNTWSEANKKCAEIGSQMVTIHSKEENDFLVLLLLFPQSDVWIGMYSTIGGRLFHWTDNSTIDYMNWDSSEPNYANGNEECVHMAFNVKETKLGKWNDHICSMRFPFICEIPKDPMMTKPGRDGFLCSQPKGWIKLGASCYQIFNESDNHLTWNQAQSYCMSVSSNLASILDFGTSAHLKRHLTGSSGFFWVGMRDTTESTYRWLGSSTAPSYTNWLSYQPRAISPLHNCVAVNEEGKWMVRNCDESHPFICENSKEPPTVAPQEPDLVCPNTTKDWKEFGGKSCYIIEIKQQVPWYSAAHSCFKLGGYLASFHSKYEMEAILYVIKASRMPVHIGLGQKEDGSFGWLDGSAIDYVNWSPGEPNADSEMCVEMHTDIGTWNDIRCGEKRGYVCSTRKVPRNLSTTDALTDKGRDLEARINAGGIAGIIICILVVLIILAVGFYYYCPSTRMRVRRQSETSPL